MEVLKHWEDEAAVDKGTTISLEEDAATLEETKQGVLEDLDESLKNLDIQKVLNAVIASQDDEKKTECLSDDDLPLYDKPSNEDSGTLGETVHEEVGMTEETEEVIELEFERAIKKLDTHTMHCPNCNAHITKVILRRKLVKKVVQPPVVQQQEPVDLLGCLSCFSFFIPTGNGFNPFHFFGNGRRSQSTQTPQQVPAVSEDVSATNINSSATTFKDERGSIAVQEQGNGFNLFHIFGNGRKSQSTQISQQVPAGNGHSSSTNISSSATSSKDEKGNITETNTSSSVTSSKDEKGNITETNISSSVTNFKDRKGNISVQEQGKGFSFFQIFGKGRDNTITQISQQTSTVDVKYSSLDQKYVQENKVTEQEKYSDQKIYDPPRSIQTEDNGHVGDYKLTVPKEDEATPPRGAIVSKDVKIDIHEEYDETALKGRRSTKLTEIKEIQSVSRDDISSVDTTPLLVSQSVPISEEQTVVSKSEGSKSIEIMKSIVYGGLVESITSLSVVASAAGSESKTLNIVALSFANLVGGLFIIGHHLWDLKDEQYGAISGETKKETSKYQDLLGRRENFPIHATFALLSFLVFGLIPPVTYGFSFRDTDDKDFKIIAVAVASFLCVVLLSTGKAYIARTPKFLMYLKTILYYLTTAFMVSGVSYAVGHLVDRLIEELGWFDTSSGSNQTFVQMNPRNPSWSTY